MFPERITHYRIVAKLGEGGMGTVYCAEDEECPRQVAIKVISGSFLNNPQSLWRFAREVEIASKLRHPHICTVYECGELHGHPYMVMEFLEGQTLRALLGGRPLPLARIIEIGSAVAGALDDAHSHGIVHRDVNSDNIFITTSGVPKLLDFGLAKSMSSAPEPLAPPWSCSDMSSPGLAIGTPSSMSPEQVQGHELDRRSDLFSLGIVLYEMATGMLPFVGVTNLLIMQAILYKLHIEASELNPRIPPEFDLIVKRALQKDRAQRYNTARELLDDLTHLGARPIAESLLPCG